MRTSELYLIPAMTVVKQGVASAISCCTCATLLTEVPRLAESEKPFPSARQLDCCGRAICGRCIHNNHRFNSYCPYCQISEVNNILPPGLKAAPSYARATGISECAPPPYTPYPTDRLPQGSLDEKSAPPNEGAVDDTLHFLDHAHDTINSLSLRYGVPAFALRRANNISSDHLLLGRRTVIIPGQYYKAGVSLSPRPVEGEEGEKQKAKIRRWMVGCKVHEYNVATLYLEQAGYDLELAMDTYFADEEWERSHQRSHPTNGARKSKSRHPTRR